MSFRYCLQTQENGQKYKTNWTGAGSESAGLSAYDVDAYWKSAGHTDLAGFSENLMEFASSGAD